MNLAALFSDHAVLQRERAVPIWGWSTPGDVVSVDFAGQSRAAHAGADGRWAVTLDPLPANTEPRPLLATSRETGIVQRIEDVLVGDVWLASGQSNMQWSVRESRDAIAEVAAASHPLIRLFTVPNLAAGVPALDLDAAWQRCSLETVGTFSAVAYYFGRELRRELDVPIGLIHASWGSTRIETWMSRAALLGDPAGRKTLAAYEALAADPDAQRRREEANRDPLAWLRGCVPADPGNRGLTQGWAAPDFDDSGWREMDVPCRWQDHGYRFSGIFWFRRAVEIPAAWTGRDLVLNVGACDKHDTTYFNGTPVGAIGWEKLDAWREPRSYRIPGALVRAGRNVIVSRVYSYMTDGGLIGPAGVMRLQLADDPESAAIPLAGSWHFEVECEFGYVPEPAQPLGPGNPNTPHILYDNMIAPLTPTSLRGVIWYQGESNADAPADYCTLFPAMIADWRRVFGQPALPFLFVQLANFGEPQREPVEDGWAGMREAQALALRVPATGMAVTIDIGDARDGHPRNKQDVGQRLSLEALGQAYGRPDTPRSPLYRGHRVEDGAITVTLDHVGTGLEAKGGPLRGFAVAGRDGKFCWAEAQLSGDEVVVHSPQVPSPMAVRYAWANNPAECNLYSREGLPAAPFRTDASAVDPSPGAS